MQFITKCITRVAHKRLWQFICLMIADSLIFGGTNSANTPSFMLIVGFIAFCLSIYCFMDGLLALVTLYGVSIKHRRRVPVTVTALAAGLAALQSIGQLSSRDVIVLSLLAGLAYVYIVHAKSTSRRLGAAQL